VITIVPTYAENRSIAANIEIERERTAEVAQSLRDRLCQMERNPWR